MLQRDSRNVRAAIYLVFQQSTVQVYQLHSQRTSKTSRESAVDVVDSRTSNESALRHTGPA